MWAREGLRVGSAAKRSQRQVVSGARRVWGTLKSASPTTVRASIVTLAKVTNLADDLHVKHKLNSGKLRWWFVLRGKEETLKALEKNWENVSLQTGWHLEQCTKPVECVVRMPHQNSDNSNNEIAISAHQCSTMRKVTDSSQESINSEPAPVTDGQESINSDPVPLEIHDHTNTHSDPFLGSQLQ